MPKTTERQKQNLQKPGNVSPLLTFRLRAGTGHSVSARFGAEHTGVILLFIRYKQSVCSAPLGAVLLYRYLRNILLYSLPPHPFFTGSSIPGICISAFGFPDMNCVAKVLVMPFFHARSKPDGSRQNLHPLLRTGSIWL